MTTDSTKAMTLEQVRDQIKAYCQNPRGPRYVEMNSLVMEKWADAIDAHLAPREVSDEDVERIASEHGKEYGMASGADPYFDFSRAQLHSFVRDLQAARQRGGGVDVTDFSSVEFDLPEGYEVEEFIPGVWQYTFEENGQGTSSSVSWNNPLHAAIAAWQDYAEALLAQRGQVREGLHECPTCGGPCDMFEEEGTFEIAYIYRSTSK